MAFVIIGKHVHDVLLWNEHLPDLPVTLSENVSLGIRSALAVSQMKILKPQPCWDYYRASFASIWNTACSPYRGRGGTAQPTTFRSYNE